MTKTELYAFLDADPDVLWAEGVHEGKPGMFLRWARSKAEADKPEVFVDYEHLDGMEYPAVRKMLLAGRDVTQITRIVGYFSRINNWNKSKLGELKDRHKGQYAVGAVAWPAEPLAHSAFPKENFHACDS